jgi:hypothetical protein
MSGQGSGGSIRDFQKDAGSLSSEEFEDRHGSAFLLHASAGPGPSDSAPMTIVQLDGLDEPAMARTAGLSQMVYALRAQSAGHLVTVGRASNNDVVVNDSSVSRFHAFLKPMGDGRFAIHDAGSTNGTTVNGTNAPAQGYGDPLELKSGDNLHLGQVELTFLDAKALREFVAAHG